MGADEDDARSEQSAHETRGTSACAGRGGNQPAPAGGKRLIRREFSRRRSCLRRVPPKPILRGEERLT
jgi:hypothetical protein